MPILRRSVVQFCSAPLVRFHTALDMSGKIKEDQLDQQRKFILERLETAREKLDDLRARESMASEKRVLMENLVQWAGKFGKGLDDLPDEKRRDVLRLLVDQVLVDRNKQHQHYPGYSNRGFCVD